MLDLSWEGLQLAGLKPAALECSRPAFGQARESMKRACSAVPFGHLHTAFFETLCLYHPWRHVLNSGLMVMLLAGIQLSWLVQAGAA